MNVRLSLVAAVLILFAGCGSSEAGQSQSATVSTEEEVSSTADRFVLSATDLLTGADVLEVKDIRATGTQLPIEQGTTIYDLYEATIVSSHRSQAVTEARGGDPISFYSPRWTDAAPLLSAVPTSGSATILARPLPPDVREVVSVEYAVEVAFMVVNGSVEPTRSGVRDDDEWIATLADAVSILESNPAMAGRVTFSEQVGSAADLVDDPVSGVRELFEPTLPTAPADATESLLGDTEYVGVQFGGLADGLAGLHFVALRTPSGAQAGFVLDGSAFVSTTLPLAANEPVSIELRASDPDDGEVIDALEYRVELADSGDLREIGVLVTANANGLTLEVVPLDDYLAQALELSD